MRNSVRGKDNVQCFPNWFALYKSTPININPNSILQQTLATAELIQLPLNSISWTALSRNHIFYWIEEIHLLCFKTPSPLVGLLNMIRGKTVY